MFVAFCNSLKTQIAVESKEIREGKETTQIVYCSSPHNPGLLLVPFHFQGIFPL